MNTIPCDVMMAEDALWVPDWRISSGVRAVTTRRCGGVSVDAFASMNTALYVGDSEDHVQHNRASLRARLSLPAEPLWLTQVHGVDIVDADVAVRGVEADGAVASGRGHVLAVMSADCLPVFLADPVRQRIGIVHAGWRGLAAGIIEKGIRRLGSPVADIHVAFGPAIGPAVFEISDDVREQLMRPGSSDRAAFTPGDQPGKWFADLYQLAAHRVVEMGCPIPAIPDACTVSDAASWYSYRRHSQTGRMASLIWIN